jgi:hypothetical protein
MIQKVFYDVIGTSSFFVKQVKTETVICRGKDAISGGLVKNLPYA